MNVVVLYGGQSQEHQVSLISAAGVIRELEKMPDVSLSLAGITLEGRWFLQDKTEQLRCARETGALTIIPDPESALALHPGEGIVDTSGTVLPVDCVFPVLHGAYGEDGTIQGLLEMCHLPYVGSGVTGSALGMDKVRAKQIWEQNNLPVVPYITVTDAITVNQAPSGKNPGPDALSQITQTATERIIGTFGFPVFVKPNAAGSSVGITRVEDSAHLGAALKRAFRVDATVLIEQALTVREIETAVLGNSDPRTFPSGEVIPSHQFYDYEAKYTDPAGAALKIPADLDPALAREIEELSRQAFLAVGAAGLARVDCFLHRETRQIYLNEINTLPGFTPISMYPKMVQEGGVTYAELLRELLTLALERDRHRSMRDYQAR
ncbi:D-alanine-D-alanine ligase [Alkalispirochaeta americana]|uniref:D-alanine--D-alanine ligase n=1 Tax=Alkalispirochaeta americana TaxID=159291 RepID=A0A1N6NBR9_9SPIO|nr:D-alanine--D-alanine ligase family protein [Alkalispirochaeta americana]SIP89427.1 D-alanine-D-alanine ligase [Alkalispirochaeta americana]